MTELTAAFERCDLSADAVDSVLKLLADEGVDVIEAQQEPEDPASRHVQAEARRAVTGDLVRIYLREIGRVPLLTAHDEVELAKAIEAGLFAEEKMQGGLQANCAGARVAELMRAVIGFPSIRTVDPQSLLRALEVYEVDRLDFAEAYLVAQAEATGVGVVLSFDKSIDRVMGVTRRAP